MELETNFAERGSIEFLGFFGATVGIPKLVAHETRYTTWNEHKSISWPIFTFFIRFVCLQSCEQLKFVSALCNTSRIMRTLSVVYGTQGNCKLLSTICGLQSVDPGVCIPHLSSHLSSLKYQLESPAKYALLVEVFYKQRATCDHLEDACKTSEISMSTKWMAASKRHLHQAWTC